MSTATKAPATRPLTVADRPVQVGDIVRGPFSTDSWRMWDRRGMGVLMKPTSSTNGPFRTFPREKIRNWVYVSRSDEGPLTVPVEENKP